MLGLSLALSSIATVIRKAFGVSSLFSAGEQGVWYDPSDFTTLFQDSAGTTPVTAVEQPVGLMRDKSGRGNHAFQSTSANRPVLSARVNLLTATEDLSNAAWTNVGSFNTVAVNQTIAPDGTNTADLITNLNTGSTFYQAVTVLSSAPSYKASISFKRGNTDWVGLVLQDGSSNGVRLWANLATGTLGTVTTIGTSATLGNYSISSQPNGFFLVSIEGVMPGTTRWVQIQTAASDNSSNRVANGTFYVWGADLRVTNVGVNLPAYQRVNTSTDYDTTGFPLYLKFNGTNSSMATNSINFTATDKMTVWAGVRKLSDAAGAFVVEHSVNSTTENGTFGLFAPRATNIPYSWRSKGTSGSDLDITSGYAAPITNVLTGTGNISGDSAILRINGTQAGSSTTNQGTGNYGNYPLYIGARAGTSLFFNGQLYSLIVRGAQSDANQIAQTESWVNQKVKAF